MATAYLVSWSGPVLEEDDPYGDGVSTEGLDEELHVQEVLFLPDGDREAIKKAVFFYGAVQTSIYNDLSGAYSSSDYYDRDKCAYCYDGEEAPNHEIIIIGWDDDYPKENFTVEVPGDGAFICQNSWGSDFGEEGIFYVSYYDVQIDKAGVAFSKVEDTDNYDGIYQSDLCGWVGQIGFERSSLYGANVYTAEEDEEVVAVGFYTTDTDSTYELYVVREYTSASDLKDPISVGSGEIAYAGYHTVELDRSIPVRAGEKFAVIVHIHTPNADYPIAVEYQADDLTRSVTLDDGEGYISRDGQIWQNTELAYGCNVCLKAYTRRGK